jgi:hypothetical protein
LQPAAIDNIVFIKRNIHVCFVKYSCTDSPIYQAN